MWIILNSKAIHIFFAIGNYIKLTVIRVFPLYGTV